MDTKGPRWGRWQAPSEKLEPLQLEIEAWVWDNRELFIGRYKSWHVNMAEYIRRMYKLSEDDMMVVWNWIRELADAEGWPMSEYVAPPGTKEYAQRSG